MSEMRYNLAQFLNICSGVMILNCSTYVFKANPASCLVTYTILIGNHFGCNVDFIFNSRHSKSF